MIFHHKFETGVLAVLSDVACDVLIALVVLHQNMNGVLTVFDRSVNFVRN